jgi:protein O-GlcNAc transferase
MIIGRRVARVPDPDEPAQPALFRRRADPGRMSPSQSAAELESLYARCPLAPGDPERLRLAAALARAGDRAGDWLNLGFEAFSAFDFPAGHRALEQALRREPNLLPAHWLRFQYPPEVAPRSDAQAERFRQRWAAGLAAFERVDFRQPPWQAQVWGCIGSCTAFYRHYIDHHLLDGQRRYGALAQRMMAALDPGDPPRPIRRGRRRVLFCSSYFYRHTVARLFVPLIEALDRGQFDLHCLHFGSDDDAMTARVRAIGQFHGGPREAPDWRRLIGELAPDVIVYLDIGMHPLPQALASLRLAPVQAMLWGHPVTTGLPTLDYVLSPDAIEPADAAQHYSERLVRLPGLGHGLDPPAAIEPESAADGTLELLCAQSVYKLMPAQDALFARIITALPQARLHMIPHQSPQVRDWLRERMRPAFAAAGVDIDSRLMLHGYRPLEEFLALAAGCALNLDSIGWSGGMSSLDLLGLGLPTVTRPGPTMRSRQTAAVLERLGVPELTVDSDDAYVELAIALGRDPARRAAVSQRLRAGLPRLDQREEVTAALAAFLASCEPQDARAADDR